MVGTGISAFLKDVLIVLRIGFGATIGRLLTPAARLLRSAHIIGGRSQFFGSGDLLDNPFLHRIWVLFRPASILMRLLKGVATLIGWYQSKLSCDFSVEPSLSFVNLRQGIDYAFCSFYPDIFKSPDAIGPAIDKWVNSAINIVALNRVAAIFLGYGIILSALDFHARLSSHRQTYMVLMLVKVRYVI